MEEVNRYLCFYEKDSDKFVGEKLIDKINLNDLLELITPSVYGLDNLLYNCYLLNEEKLSKLSKLLNENIVYNLDKYEYFLEATSK
ncbi:MULTISPECIES: DUF7683 domain-containing protein [Flavobacterium]|uniref:DUF7683 domain-containing protein n=1 Tax=Flavobacterium hankyongi TaxID=1176532 RepID=A0ABP8ZW46_9FLAO|nr:hypothetical protein [Flavobacterium sp. N1846]